MDRRPQQTFLQRTHRWANRHMKRRSTSPFIREMRIKPQWDTTSHQSEGLSSINQRTTSVRRMGGKRISGVTVNWCSHYGNTMEFPQKLKTELPYDPANALLGIYLKKSKTLIQQLKLLLIFPFNWLLPKKWCPALTTGIRLCSAPLLPGLRQRTACLPALP